MSLSFSDALSFFDTLLNFERIPNTQVSISSFNLERVFRLEKEIGNPELEFATIHVAGTKGKGSTAAFVASILQASGRKVGLYTSPHLRSIRERIQVNRVPISEEDFSRITEKLQAAIRSMEKFSPSYFEVLTALSFLYFAGEKVDVAVIETGLGGRGDATNIVSPLVSIITSISLDHVAILGNSLELIAKEKAGIIKPHGMLISAPQENEVLDIFEKECVKQNAQFFLIGRDINFKKLNENFLGQSFSVQQFLSQDVVLSKNFEKEKLWIPLLGDHQVENACTAIGAVLALKWRGIDVTFNSIKDGLQKVQWWGRFQIISHNPHLVVDGAHNPYSAFILKKTLNQVFGKVGKIFIVGTSVDKDISGIIAQFARVSKFIICTSSGHSRAALPETICNAAMSQGIQAVESPDISSALQIAREKARKEEVICVTGSLFLVGEALHVLD